jgi:transcriptional regulator with PAS, ATPase and Fis domain
MQPGLVVRPGERPGPGIGLRPPPDAAPPAFVTCDPAMLRVLETAARLARSGQPVLLLGETGTGKEVLARVIHHGSPRAAGPFRAVNCAALCPGLLEAELFGAARGAYTGADEARPGLLEAAHGGTLFLDEVGDMPLPLQAALLRVLEDGLTRRLGDTAERRADFRIVAATNRDLAALADGGQFRPDLLWRLGRALRLPALRERPGDVLLLARVFLAEAAGGGVPFLLSEEAEAWLLTQRFPGNVRELRCRVLAGAALSDGGVVRVEDLAGEDGALAIPAAREAVSTDGTRTDRVLAALRRLEPVPVAAIVRETGLPRRTVQRVLSDLVRERGLVRRGKGPATRYMIAAEEDPRP